MPPARRPRFHGSGLAAAVHGTATVPRRSASADGHGPPRRPSGAHGQRQRPAANGAATTADSAAADLGTARRARRPRRDLRASRASCAAGGVNRRLRPARSRRCGLRLREKAIIPWRRSGTWPSEPGSNRAQPRHRGGNRQRRAVPWRPQPYGQRVLVFDTETTTDAAQRLLFGFFRLYEEDRLIREGLIAADVLDQDAMEAIVEYAARCRLPIYSRERFVEEVFYPEAYVLGTLCVGFNLPFDLTRIAIQAGTSRGEHRRKFRIVLSRRLRWHDLRIESASGRAAFINFVPKRKLFDWERPFFSGRFCDLSMVATAFSGKRHSLRSAGSAFAAYTRKMKVPTSAP